MREASRHVAEILLELRELREAGRHDGRARPRRREGDRRARASRRRSWATARTGCRRIPAVLCVSVNDEIVHGIPGPRVLERGRHREPRLRRRRATGSTATRPSRCRSGQVDDGGAAAARGDARGALIAASSRCVPGKRLSDIGHAVQEPRRARGLLGGARVRRARHRPQDARAAPDSELRAPRAAGRGCCRAWCSRSSRW